MCRIDKLVNFKYDLDNIRLALPKRFGIIEEAIAYLIRGGFPNSTDTKKHLAILLYLSDWRHCIEEGTAITDISWSFNYGIEALNYDIESIYTEVFYFLNNEIGFLDKFKYHVFGLKLVNLTGSQIQALNHVIKVTSKLPMYKTTNIALSTYPVMTSDKRVKLDLETKSIVYNRDFGRS